MRQLTAFIKKEWMELVRSGKLALLLILAIAFGIMSPAIAKLTPVILEMMAESLEESGMTVTEVTVDAMTSWTQFYKNVPMALIVFALLFSGILASEYQKGTLINSVTKGMKRWKIFFAKWVMLILNWSVCYWLCYGITYIANDLLWDNSVAENIFFGAVCFYLLGIWILTLMLSMSVYLRVGVLAALVTGGGYLVSYALSVIPAVKHYMPSFLGEGLSILTGAELAEDCSGAIIVTVGCILIFLVLGMAGFNKRQI